MSREILFRAKTTKCKWVYGYPNIYDDKSINFVVGKLLNSLLPMEDCCVNIKYDTLGQFTGLTDKNGKKIFEGDIVRGKNFLGLRREGVVFYDEIDGIYKIKPATKSNYRESNENELLYPTDGYIEILGNIHDNPELLQEK